MEVGVEIRKPEVDQRVELMKPLFSEKTKIEKRGEGVYAVESVLDEGICEGGQKAELRLTLEKEQNEPYMSIEGLLVKPYVTFRIDSFVVNGQELINDDTKVYLTSDRIPKPHPESLSEEEKQYLIDYEEEHNNDLINEDDQALADIRKNVFLLNNLKTSDNLVAFFHEKGHILRENGDINLEDVDKIYFGEYEERISKIKQLRLRAGFFNKNRMTIFQEINEEAKIVTELFRKKIYEERRASIKALELLKNYKELFPKDSNNIRAKLYLSAALSTHIKEGADELSCLNDIALKEADVMTNLDKDWHC